MLGIKHLIQCHCILSQYKNSKNPVFHNFVVFSTVNCDDSVNVKFVTCNNCGVIHRVHDICKSEILYGNDDVKSLITIDDLRSDIPTKITNVLDSYACDIPVWEEVKFALDNENFNRQIILNKIQVKDEIQVKILNILSKDKFKIDVSIEKLDLDEQ